MSNFNYNQFNDTIIILTILVLVLLKIPTEGSIGNGRSIEE